jgi:hypothetical protein
MRILVILSLILALAVVSLFKYSLNRVFPIGPFYFIRRDNGSKSMPVLCKGFMNEISSPWRRGKGLQIRIRSQVLQVGLCKKYPDQREDEGVLSAIGGRYMDTEVKDIREW